MKAILVARVSTEEQKEAGNSLPAQLSNLEGYCKKHGYTLATKPFSFEESAYKTKRDEFDKVIKYIEDFLKKSQEKLIICFDKVDRLSRNIFDKRIAWLYYKAVKGEVEIHFVSDNQIVNDRMSAGDKFMFEMKLGLSKYYSDATSDNVKRAFEQKRRSGQWTGAVRLGYLNVALDEEKRLRKDIIIDPMRGPLVKRMFELYATGNWSIEAIRTEITRLGLRTLKGNDLSKSGAENILKDSFYCGIAMSKKYGSYVHQYPRLINKELFDICQDIRSGRRNNFFKTKDYVFKGLLKCKHCGCSMSPEYHCKPNGKEYIIYSCTNAKRICKRHYVNEKDLLAPIYEVLERFGTISEDVQNDLVEELRKSSEAEITFNKVQINRIRGQYDLVSSKKDKLLEAYLETSITKDIYDKKNQEYSDQLQLLNIELQEHTKADYDYQTTVATVISVARRAREVFDSSEVNEKRTLLSFLLQNATVYEKKLYFSIASPFNLVLELADNPNWLALSDDFRTINWAKEYPFPSLALEEIKGLLRISI